MLLFDLIQSLPMNLHSFLPPQFTVAAQTRPPLAARRRGDPRRPGGTPRHAPDQQATHRWADSETLTRKRGALLFFVDRTPLMKHLES